MSVNVRAAFVITQHAVKQMKAQSPQGGRIISQYRMRVRIAHIIMDGQLIS